MKTNTKETLTSQPEEVSEIDAYYAKVSQQLIQLIKDKKYTEALDILNEEIEQVYIPFDVLNNYLKTRDDIQLHMREDEYQNKFKDMSKNEMWNLIYNQQKHTLDISYFCVFMEKWDELNDLDFSFIKEILTDENINNIEKASFFQIVLDYHISDDIPVQYDWYNDYLQHKFKVTDESISIYSEQLKSLVLELDNIFMKDPSRNSIASDLLYALHAKFIPLPINFDKNDIIITLKNITNALFDNGQIIDNDITVLLKEFLE